MKLCITCGDEIPAKRLEIVPNTKFCVPCLTKAGDVPRMRRFDEVGIDGEINSTFYVQNNYIERHQNSLDNFSIPEDDEPEGKYDAYTEPVDHLKGYAMSEAFEEDEETEDESA